jgi:hypothetical protein
MFPEYKFSDEEIKKRYENFYGDERVMNGHLRPGRYRRYVKNYPTFLNLFVK